MTSKSKKFLKVIDGLRAWNLAATISGNSHKAGIDIKEVLKSDHFHLGTVAEYGFPFQPTCMTFDPVQRILAIGTRRGCIKLFGRPGVEFHLEHPSPAEVLQLIFLVNEGGLISICKDDVVHLWNIRQKPPDIVHSLQFKRETLTCGYLAVSSSWLGVGSEQGNVHFVNVQQFTTSGYVINWNKAINLSQSQRPGSVVQMAEHPQDSNKLLVGYSSGLLLVWDLRGKTAEARFQYHEPLYSFAWHWEGRSFISAHKSGVLVTWAYNQPKRPQSVICPHAGDDEVSSAQFAYEPIRFVQWLPMKNGEPVIVFAGGLRRDSLDAVVDADDGASSTPSITIMRGKRLAVMQMDFHVVTFTTLCSSPYFNESCDPYAVAVLLEQDLVLVDLTSPGFPSFENPYPMDISVSPVTACHYVVDCPADLVPAFYAVGSRGRRAAAAAAAAAAGASRSNNHEGATDSSAGADVFSAKKWPIDGGEWGTNLCSYQELIITGHADGSVRFWDASGVNLTPLYKVRTNRYFARSACSFSSYGENRHPHATADQSSHYSPDQIFATALSEPLAIHHIRFCVDSRTLLLAGQRHLCLLSFCRSESVFEIPTLDVYLHYEEDQGVDPSLGVGDETSSVLSSSSGRRVAPQPVVNSMPHSACSVQLHGDRECKVSVVVRSGVREWGPGYQPSLICRLASPSLPHASTDAEDAVDVAFLPSPPPISAVALTSATNLFAFGTDGGIVVVDYYQGICLVCAAVPELEALDLPNRPRTKSSPRFSNSGNGSKSNPTNQRSPPLSRQASMTVEPDAPAQATPVLQTAQPLHHKLLRRSTVIPSAIHREVRRPFRRMSSLFTESPDRQTANQPHQHHHLHIHHHHHHEHHHPITTSSSTDTKFIDFRGTNGTKPKTSTDVEPGVVLAASPLLAANKYGDSLSQRQSDASGQSSIDQTVLEGVKTLAFVDMSERKNEPSLWVGTSRGSVFGFTLDLSEDRSPQTPNYSLLGSLFKFDGEVVHIGFGNAHGEMCNPPSAKWETGGSFAPRLTLVPQPEEGGAGSEVGRLPDAAASGDAIFGSSELSSTSTAALRRLGATTATTPPAPRHAASLNQGGSIGGGATNNSCEEAFSSSGSNQVSVDSADRHFMVVVSEKHAQVIGFPSRNCYNRVKITETSSVIRAELGNQRMPISGVSPSPSASPSPPTTTLFVSCLLSNGHVIIFSLPTLRILSDVGAVSKHFHQCLFTFGNLGQAIYMSSPSELTKITMAADLSNNLSEMHGELFLPCNMPEPPKKNFFTNLFTGSGLSPADRDVLFGEQQSGKSTSGTAALLPSARMDRLGAQTGGATSEIARARNAAIERGEKLGQLDTQTQEMMDQSKNLSKTAALLAAKYEKQDKWWGVWPR